MDSNHQLLREIFKNFPKYSELSNFNCKIDGWKIIQESVGCFVNVHPLQTRNYKAQIESIHNLRIFLKFEDQLFYLLFQLILPKLKIVLTTPENNDELKISIYLLFYDFINVYFFLTEEDRCSIFYKIFEILVALLVEDNTNNDIVKLLMNCISNSLAFDDVFFEILKFSKNQCDIKSCEISLLILKSLFLNSSQENLINLEIWDEFFNLYFKVQENKKMEWNTMQYFKDTLLTIINQFGNNFSDQLKLSSENIQRIQELVNRDLLF